MPQAQQVQEELPEPEEKLIPSDAPAADGEPPKVTIDLAEADEEPAEAKAPDDRRPPRHKSQWRQMKEQHERELSDLKQKLEMLEGRVSSQPPVVHVQPPPQQQQQAPAQDPVEQEIQSLWRQQQRTLAAIRSGQFSNENVVEMENDWRQLDRKRRALEAKADNPRREEAAAADPDAYARTILSAEYPEIYAKKSLQKMAEAEMESLMEMGKPYNIVTAREALERVAARRGLGRKTPPPSDAERARHSGVSARAGATPAGSEQYTPSKYIMGLARAYTSHLPDMSDEDRYKHWRRYVGKKEGLVP